MTQRDLESDEGHSPAESKYTVSDQVTQYLLTCWLILCVVGCVALLVVCSVAWLFGGFGEALLGAVAPGWVQWCVYLPAAVIVAFIVWVVKSFLRNLVSGQEQGK